jgi:tetratricopeptide (TPR) repeat protein
MEFAYNVDRDAYATIAGFVLQVDLTVLRWLNLDDSETLELECGEDIDTVGKDIRAAVSQGTRLFEQVKRRQANLTLRSPVSLEALANFAEHRSANPDWHLRFRLLTTAKVGREQQWEGDLDGIALWEAARTGALAEVDRSKAVHQIRALLLDSPAPSRISTVVWEIFKTVVRSDFEFSDFIDDFEWSTSAEDYLATEEKIRVGLIQAGLADTPEQAEVLSERLFAFTFRLLSQAGTKRITRAQLLAEVSRSTQSQSDLKMVALIRSQLANLGRRMEEAEGRLSSLESSSTTTQATLAALTGQMNAVVEFIQPRFLVDVPDLVTPAIARQRTVGLILESFQSKTTVNIIGEPGSGKTQLCLLVAKAASNRLIWIDIPRGATPSEACAALDATLAASSGGNVGPVLANLYEQIATSISGSLIVIDNLPRFLKGDPLARRIELLTRYFEPTGTKLLVTSYFSFPKRIGEQTAAVELQAPRFDEDETPELLVAYGAPAETATKLTTLIHTATQGLPVLMTAVARYLSSKCWVFDIHEFEAIVKADFARPERIDAREILRLTVPDESTRELLYRLTLVIGGISKEQVQRIARIKQPILLPLEKIETLVGLWLQPFMGNTYTISPLIDPAVSELLDKQTRIGVHAILALTITSKGTIYPLDAVTCIHHFTAAGLYAEAAFVLASALTTLIDAEPELVSDSMVLASIWIADIPDQIDQNLKLHIRSLQIEVMDNRGRAIDFLLTKLDQELDAGGSTTWGGLLATSFIAIRFCKKHPAIANRYLLKYYQIPNSVLMPDGKSFDLEDSTLIGIFWATAQYAASDEEVNSWLETVQQLTPEQIKQLDASPFKEDSASVLCDGIWLRDYRKAPVDRDWDRVEALVSKVQKVGANLGLKTLEAAAIRTRIMMLAEWRHDLQGALELTRVSLPLFNNDGDAFLLTEVMGRQLSYAGKPAEAIEWLERARSYPIREHELWRRNVLITLAELVAKADPARAVALVREAVALSRATLGGERTAESCAEEAIALWNANDRKAAFESLEEAVKQVLEIETDTSNWKEVFLTLFRVVIYFSSIEQKGDPPVGSVEPTQGVFLGTDGLDTSLFYPAQKAYLHFWMAKFAESLRLYARADVWLDGAMRLAEEFPSGKNIYSYAGYWVAYPLLRDDFREAVRRTILMADANPTQVDQVDKTGKPVQQFDTPKLLSEARVPFSMIAGFVPSALRLATLRLRGATDADIAVYVGVLIDGWVGRLSADAVSQALRESVLSNMSSSACYQRAGSLIPTMETMAAGMIYMVGSAIKAEVQDALIPQTWLALTIEKLFPESPSVREELLFTLLETYWRQQVVGNGHLFRSGAAFTLRKIDEVVRALPSDRTKQLLRSMDICIPTVLSSESRSWLSS